MTVICDHAEGCTRDADSPLKCPHKVPHEPCDDDGVLCNDAVCGCCIFVLPELLLVRCVPVGKALREGR